MGDIDGDGTNDLVFARDNSGVNTVSVIFGAPDLPRTLGLDDVDRNITVLNLDLLTVQAPDWNGDAHADLMIRAGSNNSYVVDGAAIDQGGVPLLADPLLAASNALATFDTTFAVGPPIVLGDVNGDGLEDVLFFERLTGGVNAYLFSGRPSVGSFDVFTQPDVTFAGLFGTASTGRAAFALGDINRDGFDDFAVATGRESEEKPALLIFYGSDQHFANAGSSVDASAADISIRHLESGEFAGGLFMEGRMVVSAGDFNGDQAIDLVVAENGNILRQDQGGTNTILDLGTRSETWVLWGAASLGSEVILADAPVKLRGEQELDLDDLIQVLSSELPLGSASDTPNLDLNRDGFDDIVLGVGYRDVLLDGFVKQAGKVHLIYGSPRPHALPAPELVTVVANRTFTGSGDFVVDRGTGQPDTFTLLDANGDGVDNFSLQTGEADAWFRFATLGAGAGGDQIRLLEPARAVETVRLVGADGTLLPTGVPGDFDIEGGEVTRLGDQSGQLGVFEFDLSNYLDVRQAWRAAS